MTVPDSDGRPLLPQTQLVEWSGATEEIRKSGAAKPKAKANAKAKAKAEAKDKAEL